MGESILQDIKPLHHSELTPASPMVVAGPCSAESEEQVIDTATQLKAMGINIFRAGVWKPRTKPGGFEGMGDVALQWLERVKEETGMKIAVEVANATHASIVLQAGVDVMWIGTRTTVNPFTVQEIARAIEGSSQVTVLVKNPINPDIELWIGAMERICKAGITRVGAIHRGFSTYNNNIYRNSPQWEIPIELHRRFPNLTLLCDPSHMGGKRELIAPLSQQALDMGFNGLFVETHPAPETAMSDSAQQITPAQLQQVLKSLVIRHHGLDNENLDILRRQIDSCDNELLEILNKRMQLCRQIGGIKKEKKMQVVQTQRYDDVLKTRISQACQLGLSQEFIKKILMTIHEESVRQQIKIVNDNDAEH